MIHSTSLSETSEFGEGTDTIMPPASIEPATTDDLTPEELTLVQLIAKTPDEIPEAIRIVLEARREREQLSDTTRIHLADTLEVSPAAKDSNRTSRAAMLRANNEHHGAEAISEVLHGGHHSLREISRHMRERGEIRQKYHHHRGKPGRNAQH